MVLQLIHPHTEHSLEYKVTSLEERGCAWVCCGPYLNLEQLLEGDVDHATSYLRLLSIHKGAQKNLREVYNNSVRACEQPLETLCGMKPCETLPACVCLPQLASPPLLAVI